MVYILVIAAVWGFFPFIAYLTEDVTQGSIFLALLCATIEGTLSATIWSENPADLPHRTEGESKIRERAILHRHFWFLVVTAVYVAVQVNHFNHFII